MDMPGDVVGRVSHVLMQIEALGAVTEQEIGEGDRNHATCLSQLLVERIQKLRDLVEPYV